MYVVPPAPSANNTSNDQMLNGEMIKSILSAGTDRHSCCGSQPKIVHFEFKWCVMGIECQTWNNSNENASEPLEMALIDFAGSGGLTTAAERAVPLRPDGKTKPSLAAMALQVHKLNKTICSSVMPRCGAESMNVFAFVRSTRMCWQKVNQKTDLIRLNVKSPFETIHAMFKIVHNYDECRWESRRDEVWGERVRQHIPIERIDNHSARKQVLVFVFLVFVCKTSGSDLIADLINALRHCLHNISILMAVAAAASDAAATVSLALGIFAIPQNPHQHTHTHTH